MAAEVDPPGIPCRAPDLTKELMRSGPEGGNGLARMLLRHKTIIMIGGNPLQGVKFQDFEVHIDKIDFDIYQLLVKYYLLYLQL